MSDTDSGRLDWREGVSQVRTPMQKWLSFWPRHFRANPDKYELVVACPSDYHYIKGAGWYPDKLEFRWSEGVMPGHPNVYEHASTHGDAR